MKTKEMLTGSRKGQFISGTILATLVGVGLTAFLGYQLIGGLAVVGNYVSLIGAFAVSLAIVYYGFETSYLDDFFSDEGFKLGFLVLIGTGAAPLAYKMFQGVLETVGGLLGVLIVGLVTLAVFFGPAVVGGSILSGATFIVDLWDILFGGEN